MERKRKNERGSKLDTETCSKPRVRSFSLPIFTLKPVVETVTSPTGAQASIPFHWEEAPGKPRRASNTRKSPDEATNCATKSLKLPPRLLGYDKFSSAPSSNPKILDNTLLPYVDVSVSCSSLFARDGRLRQWTLGALCCNKISEEHKQRRQFGSWGGSNHHHEDCFDQLISSKIGGVGDPIINTLLPYVDVSVSCSSLFARDGRLRQWTLGALCCNKISEEHKQRRQFGSWGGSNHHHEDCFDQLISSKIGGVGDPIINTNVMKIKKSRRALSLSNLSPHFMASIYASLRQVVPWNRKKSL